MRLLLCATVLAAACGADASGPCQPTSEPCSFSHGFGTSTVLAGEEIDDYCQSWTLNNPTELWVREVRMHNDGAYHHANWFVVPDNYFELPDGAWNCDEQSFDELNAAVLGGVLYAMSTQSTDEVQSFPSGAAVRIPPYSRVIGNNHMLNPTDADVVTEMTIEFDTIPTDELSVKLTPFRFNYLDLHIAPETRSEFRMSCDLATEHQEVLGEPLAFDLYYVLPHYHALGDLARLEGVGGERDGELIFETEGFDAESHNRTYDPPLRLIDGGGTGFTYTCGFDNPRAQEVGYGIGDQEMCVMLGFAETQMAFDASVYFDEGAVGDTRPDGTVENGGPCDVVGFLFRHDKPGGPPR